MAHLPEGWEADYDGTRWFYRFATTGLTQYHFPRPGDEYPELVDIGFGPLDLGFESKLESKAHEIPTDGIDSAKVTTVKTTAANEGGGMSATGYFDPDDFMYFGLNDASPVDDKTNTSESTLAELPEESERLRSPVGFVAELANNDTPKCAEELAPIEMDATQIAPAALLSSGHQNGPVELPTQKRPEEQKPSTEHSVQDTARPNDEYPLVSASFAYPSPTKPVDDVMRKTDSPLQPEQKVLASQQPTKGNVVENGYETWKPTQGSVNQESANPNRTSIIASSVSVLQSQNSDLGTMEHKRNSVAGSVDSKESIPGILRPPSDPKNSSISSLPSKAESSPVPAVLQPAATPLNALSSHQTHNGVPFMPGLGARHESISFNSGTHIAGSSLSHVPSVLKPAHERQSLPPTQSQPTPQAQVDNIRPETHRVNTMPAQPSSRISLPPKINGPGIYIFQEIPVAPSGQGQSLPISNHVGNSHPGIGQAQGKPELHSTGSHFQQVNVHQSPQTNHPTPYQATPLHPTPSKKLIRKPVLPQRPEKVNYHTEISMTSNIPIRPNQPTLQQGVPSAASTRPTSVVQLQPQSPPPQSSHGTPHGQHVQIHNQRPSVSGSSFPTPQQVSTAYGTHSSTPVQGQPSVFNMPGHGSPSPFQASNQGVSPSNVLSQHIMVQGPISNPQITSQRPPVHAAPSSRPPNNPPNTQATGQVQNQNTILGSAAGPVKPPNSPSSITQPVSPLQSQVSSPAPSVASLYRPPSSVSSLSTQVTPQAVGGQGPSGFATQPNHPQVIRPTAASPVHVQGNQQTNMSPKPPTGGPSKPFPMLPGQVTPLPSQVGSAPMSTPIPPVTSTQMQTQNLQNNAGHMKPNQQHPGSQMPQQTAVQRPPQPQLQQQQQQLNPGGFMPGQHRPPVHTPPAQQHTHAHPYSNMTSPGPYTNQGTNQVGYLPSGHPIVSVAQGVAVQGQAQMTVSPNAANFQGQSFNQQVGMGQYPVFQPGVSQTFGQNKPFNSAQAAAALSDAGKKMNDAGKKMKKWAKKTWQNPALKQTTAVVGGVIIAETLGGDGMAGASIANQLYGASQGQPQNGQPQRPPGLQHANTAPAQAQNVAGIGAMPQNTQALGRPQLQQGMQPMGVQTPGRPPVVQNLGMGRGAVNNPMMQQQAQMQSNMMNQQRPYQVTQPPVGRPPFAQPQQPGFQQSPAQPLYQVLPNQPVYQGGPYQPNLQPQPQGGPDPYMAVGSMIGGAVNALAAGGKTNDAPPTTHQQQQQATTPSAPQQEPHPSQHQPVESEPHHESQQEQHQGGQSEHHHTEQPQQYQEGHHEQQYTGNHSEQHHEPYAEQNYSESHQGAYAESHTATHTEQQYTNHSEQQQNTAYSEETRQPHPEQQNHSAYSEPPPTQENSYFTSAPAETTIINNNNTIINNVDNSNNTAIANATQTNSNAAYTDNTQNTQVMETNNASAEANTYVDAGYMNTMNTETTGYGDMQYTDATNAEATAYADMGYTDTNAVVDTTAYTDTANMNINTTAEAEATVYAETTYADPSTAYTDAAYTDTGASTSYMDAAAVDVSLDVNVSMDVNADTNGYGVMMEESVSFDAGACYVDASTVDYSGGDWGGGEW